MATNKIKHVYDYGDAVKIKSNAPERYKPGKIGSICGIRIIENTETAKEFDQPLDTELYAIEFDKGEAIEIPIMFLIKYTNRSFN